MSSLHVSPGHAALRAKTSSSGPAVDRRPQRTSSDHRRDRAKRRGPGADPTDPSYGYQRRPANGRTQSYTLSAFFPSPVLSRHIRQSAVHSHPPHATPPSLSARPQLPSLISPHPCPRVQVGNNGQAVNQTCRTAQLPGKVETSEDLESVCLPACRVRHPAPPGAPPGVTWVQSTGEGWPRGLKLLERLETLPGHVNEQWRWLSLLISMLTVLLLSRTRRSFGRFLLFACATGVVRTGNDQQGIPRAANDRVSFPNYPALPYPTLLCPARIALCARRENVRDDQL